MSQWLLVGIKPGAGEVPLQLCTDTCPPLEDRGPVQGTRIGGWGDHRIREIQNSQELGSQPLILALDLRPIANFRNLSFFFIK